MTRALALGLVALVGPLLLTGCGGDDATSTTTPGPAQETSLHQCGDALPDDAFVALGWRPSGDASLDSGTCTRAGDQGDLAVQRYPVAAVGGSDLPQAAQDAFDERCGDLYGEQATRVDWLGDATPSCVSLGGRTGTSTILALTPEHTLVEARVSATADTAPDRVRAGLVALAEAGAATF